MKATITVAPCVDKKQIPYGEVLKIPEEWSSITLEANARALDHLFASPAAKKIAVAVAFIERNVERNDHFPGARRVYVITDADDHAAAYRKLIESGQKVNGPYCSKVGLLMVDKLDRVEIPKKWEAFPYRYFNGELETEE